MSDATISTQDLLRALLHAGQTVTAARDELCDLDAVAGDGDLGVTLARGFDHVEQALGSWDGSDAGALLKEIGLQLARNAPSTIGALLATAFLRMAKEVDGAETLDAGQIASMLESASRGVAERGGAEPGQRTVLDAMDPAARRARAAADSGADPLGTLSESAAAAAEGAAATAGMEPRHGRAGWIAERARGQRDAGAVAWAIYLEGLAEGLTPHQAPGRSHAQPR